MNGLKYIRTVCNLSLSELAEAIGVSRQAISAWECRKKGIPEKRLEQLSNFFGIAKEYFGEITEDQKQSLFGKPMFRYYENGRETFRYKPQAHVTDISKDIIYFCDDDNLVSIDGQYMLAKKRKMELLKEIDNIIKWTDTPHGLMEQSLLINRNCDIYDMLNTILLSVKQQERHLKVCYRNELLNIWKAMMVAFGLLDKNDLEFIDKTDPDYFYGEDGEWILQLAQQFTEHWAIEHDHAQEHYSRAKQKIRENREKRSEQNEAENIKSIDEQIAEAEKRHAEFN